MWKLFVNSSFIQIFMFDVNLNISYRKFISLHWWLNPFKDLLEICPFFTSIESGMETEIESVIGTYYARLGYMK